MRHGFPPASPPQPSKEKGSGTFSSDYRAKQYCITLLGLLSTLYLVPDCGECARSAPHAHQPGNKWLTDINTQSIAGLDVISGWIKAWQLCDLLETCFQSFRILLSLPQPKSSDPIDEDIFEILIGTITEPIIRHQLSAFPWLQTGCPGASADSLHYAPLHPITCAIAPGLRCAPDRSEERRVGKECRT